jgi:hypothetical protein
MTFDEIYEIIKTIPVSINNYYGDPVIQWANTMQKIERLAQDRHTGPVSVITKGHITKEMALELKEKAKQLNLIVLVSISELPREIEPIGQKHRYATLATLNDTGIPVISYIRPLIPPYNTTEEAINEMYCKTKESGTDTVIISGFRGNDEIITDTNPDEKGKWVSRVKLMPQGIAEIIDNASTKYGITTFSRTSCGVSYKLGFTRSFNPYYNSPIASGCGTCPLKDTCGPVPVKPGSLELIRLLGYKTEYKPATKKNLCKVTADNRLSCPSCCTSCFVLDGIERIDCKTEQARLGDIAFMRFLTGILCSGKNIADNGQPDVGHVTFPAIPMPKQEIHCLNTWYPWSRETNKCFGCSYCITKIFNLEEKEYGLPPKELAEHIYRMQGGKKQCDSDALLNASIA